MKYILALLVLFFLTLNSSFITHNSLATVDPLSTPNNEFGIHIITTDSKEASAAADLVNSQGGDWGYVTVIIQSGERDHNKWQKFFDELRVRHLIPIVRLATQPEGESWKKPYEGEEQAWADFLDKLIWPTKNRYVTVYNEPNHATEWGNQLDPKDYAYTLEKTIDALKKKSADFFVLNAGLDASAPQKPPAYLDELEYLKMMDEVVPGIFNKLDGWVSHSYPNPGFTGSPSATGRGSIRTYLWELEQLKKLGLAKQLPVFITETGWKHSDGIKFEKNLPSPQQVGENYKKAFSSAWNSNQIVAVTPFLLNYQAYPFDHFSFTTQEEDLGLSAKFHEQYFAIQSLPKIKARPIQDNKAELTKGEVYKTLVSGETYEISLTLKNTGQSIWNEYEQVQLFPLQGRSELGIQPIKIPEDIKVEPGKEYTFKFNIKAPESGSFKTILNLYTGGKQFDSKPLEFTTEVKTPVYLTIKGQLKWKENAAGEYILKVVGIIGETMDKISLDQTGQSDSIQARNLLPDYTYNFTLEKPFYYPRTISKTIISGGNILDFGELEPNLIQLLLNPLAFWMLLPWSN